MNQKSGDSFNNKEASSAQSPFRHRTFLILWLATVLSNTGTWMHDVGAGWLMTSLAPSPLIVAMVQTATTLPIFLFALPAGALADTLDRRKMLMVVQLIMGVLAATLGVLALLDAVNSTLLLLLTFLMGTGAAFVAPAWQSIVPTLVPKPALQQAVAANSVGINISRAIGPALAGFLITAVGVASPFLVNALSFGVVIFALSRWKPTPADKKHLPPEALMGAIAAGLRYARHSAPLKATLIRALAFFFFASAYWALLPLITHELLKGGASLYGILLGSVGAGAVSGAMLLPRFKKYLSADTLVAVGTLGTVVTLCSLALFDNRVIAALTCGVAGMSWIIVLTSLNVSAQVALPDWVRARGLSIFITVFFGAMSAGSLVWGQVATKWGIPYGLLSAAAGALVMIPLTWRWKLQLGVSMDLAPSAHWPAPLTDRDVEHDQGPVMVTIEYTIDPERRAKFTEVMHQLSKHRRRDGAYAWGIFEDAAVRGRFLEYFLVSSWLEHLRQHHRATRTDQDIQQQAKTFHIGKDAPQVSHFIASNPIQPD